MAPDVRSAIRRRSGGGQASDLAARVPPLQAAAISQLHFLEQRFGQAANDRHHQPHRYAREPFIFALPSPLIPALQSASGRPLSASALVRTKPGRTVISRAVLPVCVSRWRKPERKAVKTALGRAIDVVPHLATFAAPGRHHWSASPSPPPPNRVPNALDRPSD